MNQTASGDIGNREREYFPDQAVEKQYGEYFQPIIGMKDDLIYYFFPDQHVVKVWELRAGEGSTMGYAEASDERHTTRGNTIQLEHEEQIEEFIQKYDWNQLHPRYHWLERKSVIEDAWETLYSKLGKCDEKNRVHLSQDFSSANGDTECEHCGIEVTSSVVTQTRALCDVLVDRI